MPTRDDLAALQTGNGTTPPWLADPLPPAPNAQPYQSDLQKLGHYALYDSLPSKALQSAWSGLTASGDAWTRGMSMDEAQQRAGDMAGLVTGGAGVVPAEANELRSGMQWLRDYPGDPAAVTAPGKNPELFHGVGGGVKLNPSFSNLTSTKIPTPGVTMLPDNPWSPEDVPMGSWMLPLYGDKTIAGQTLVDVNGRPLATPQDLGGGGRFMQANPGLLWASDQAKATKISGKVQPLEQESGQPVLGTHVSMGAPGSDFAKMTARPLLQLTDQKAISSNQAQAFDEQMAAKGVTNWPGIKNVDEDWLNAPGSNRAALAKTMQLAPFANDPAFGSVAAVRKAITEPELMHQPMLTSGMSIGQFAPGGAVAQGAGTHETYNTDWLGQHLGNMGQVPFDKMFPDMYNSYMAKFGGDPKRAGLANIGRTVELTTPAQKIDQQWLENIMPWWERRNDQ
jgi:hypothetical protein